MACARGCCATPREHYLSVGLSAAATPTRQGARVAKRIDDTEKKWERDFDAYRRLRKDGLQPKSSDGCYEIERDAADKVEVENNTILDKSQKLAIKELTAE